MANKSVQVELSTGVVATAIDLGMYLLHEDVAPALKELLDTGMNAETKEMTTEQLIQKFGENPSSEDIAKEMNLNMASLGKLVYQLVPIGIEHPKITIGFLNEEQRLGPTLKYVESGDTVDLQDAFKMFGAIMEAGGMGSKAASTFPQPSINRLE